MTGKRSLLCIALMLLLAPATAWASPSATPIEIGAFTSPTIIDFDTGRSTHETLDTQYLGLGVDFFGYGEAFTPGSTWSARICREWHTQTSPCDVGGGAQVLEFVQPQLRAGAYVAKFNGQHYLHAFDAAQNLVLTRAVQSGSNDDPNYDFLGVEYAPGIKYLAFSDDNLGGGGAWSGSGLTTYWDTLYFESGQDNIIPEPTALLFFGTGLVGVVGYVARRRTRRS